MIKVIVPTYNSEKWIGLCIEILKVQTYTDFECILIDDGSSDKTSRQMRRAVDMDQRFNILTNGSRRGTSLGNYVDGFDILEPDDEDIIVWIDGDDWLSDVYALETLFKIYENNDCWMTYGSWKVYPTGETLDTSTRVIPQIVHDNNAYRQYQHCCTHLRTHKAFLLNAIDRQDLIDPRIDEYFCEANDTAYLFPMLEMSGPGHIYLTDEVLYILNRENPLNEHKLKAAKQKETEMFIRGKKPYDRLTR